MDQDFLQDALFAFLCRKYVQRADERQRGMGLQYTESETHDLAKEIARFILQMPGLGDVITPMKSGEKPTEPGWYVTSWYGRQPRIDQVVQGMGELIIRMGDCNTYGIDADRLTFIARIYPERITT